MLAYHIDRSDSIKPNTTISYPKFQYDSKTINLIEQYFDKNISKHGNRYLRSFDLRKSPDLGLYNSYIIELTYELFRAAYYPNELSRFESLFFTDKEHINTWLNKLSEPAHVIIASIPESKPFDERFLHSFIGQELIEPTLLYEYADYYWSHKFSEHPILEYLAKPPIRFENYYYN